MVKGWHLYPFIGQTLWETFFIRPSILRLGADDNWTLYRRSISKTVHAHKCLFPTAGCCQCAHTATRCVAPGPGRWQFHPCWKAGALGWMRRDERPALSWLSLLPGLKIPPLNWSESGWGGETVLEGEERWRRNGEGKKIKRILIGIF